MTSEFNIIQQYFTRPTRHTQLGVGDDAALIKPTLGMQLAVSTDMLVAGTHFFYDAAPYCIGWKSLAVNVSDMAAMGAQSKWATLAIALPNFLADSSCETADELRITPAWLADFSSGFFDCADAFNVDLIGGDTTRGPLTISVTILGEVPTGQALRRDKAQLHDDIWVSGTLGNASMALAILENRYVIDNNWPDNEWQKWMSCLHLPQPRATLGSALREIATSCIDVSDGLMADLGHILAASNLGATITLDRLPMSLYNQNHLDEAIVQQCVLAGGDDYELCFSAPKSAREKIIALGIELDLQITHIGSICPNIGLQVMYKNTELKLTKQGFDHFG